MRWPWRNASTMNPTDAILPTLYAATVSEIFTAAFALASGASWDNPRYSWRETQLLFHIRTPLTSEELLQAMKRNQQVGISELREAYYEAKRVLAEAKQQRGQG